MKTNRKKQARVGRRKRVRKKVLGTPERPRLNVFRSARHIYAQLIDDSSESTLVSASSLSPELKGTYGGNVECAKAVGALVAKKAVEAGIKQVVFDRSGFLYHGRIKALAESAREEGLLF